MVALKQLFDDPQVEFVSGRNFRFAGTDYKVGDSFDRDDIKNARNRESLLRSGRVLPVTNDLNDIPRAYRKTIKDRNLTFRKLKREDNQDYTTTGRTVAKVQADLAERLILSVWADALLSEVTGQNRVTLVNWIKAGPEGGEPFTDEDLETFVSDEGNYDEGEPLAEFTYPDDAESAYPV